MKTTPRQWPNDYLSWTGSFSDLVTTAAEVVALLEPSVKAPTERSLRDYQQRGLLGRGQRQGGNKAVFGFDDLQRVVATKGLVKQNWTLAHASSLLNSDEPAEAEVVQLMYASPQSFPLGGALMANAAGSADSASNASAVVARLMARPAGFASAAPGGGLQKSALYVPGVSPQGHAGMSPTQRRGLHSPAPVFDKKTAAQPSTTAYASTPVESIRPAPWLTVYIDQDAAQGAPEDERALARAALQSVLDRLG